MYVFLHVPKTAGTSLRVALEAQFPEKQLAECYGRGTISEKLQKALKQQKKMIYGHISFEDLQKAGPYENYQLLSFFRHPVERCISAYVHFLNTPDDTRRKEIENMGGFMGFLESYYGNNWQCQYLAGAKYNPKALVNPEQIFAVALENTKTLAWVGVTERYTESLISLRHFMGLKKIPHVSLNLSRDRELKAGLKEEFTNEILRRNEYDLKLWMLANECLDRQLQDVGFLGLKKMKYNLLKALA